MQQNIIFKFLSSCIYYLFMKKETKDQSFIKPPYYKEGNAAMMQKIYSLLTYPKEALIQGIEGHVTLKYDINHEGKVIDAKAIKGLGYGCDAEAIRVIKLINFEVPKNPRRLKVTFHKNITIHFKMPVPAPKANVPTVNNVNIQYTITPTPPSSSQKEAIEKKVIHYTINLK
jgi:TonB family protein